MKFFVSGYRRQNFGNRVIFNENIKEHKNILYCNDYCSIGFFHNLSSYGGNYSCYIDITREDLSFLNSKIFPTYNNEPLPPGVIRFPLKKES